MFESFEEYAQIMNIPETHPYYEAFKMVWRMARSPSFPEEITSESNTYDNPEDE